MKINPQKPGINIEEGDYKLNIGERHYKLNIENRYSILVKLWIHQNRILYQWPAVVLAAIFVAVTELLNDITDITKWGVDKKLQFGTSIPLLVIGIGTLIMTYTMRRHQKILQNLEKQLKTLDPILYRCIHLRTKGIRGSILLQIFLTIIGSVLLSVSVLSFTGTDLHRVKILLLVGIALIGIRLCINK